MKKPDPTPLIVLAVMLCVFVSYFIALYGLPRDGGYGHLIEDEKPTQLKETQDAQ